jgi:small conductance mechanosensitive channel
MENTDALVKAQSVFDKIMEQLGVTSAAKLMQIGINLILAILIFLIGKWIVYRLAQYWKSLILKVKKDPTLAFFSYNLTRFIGMIFVLITALAI